MILLKIKISLHKEDTAYLNPKIVWPEVSEIPAGTTVTLEPKRLDLETTSFPANLATIATQSMCSGNKTNKLQQIDDL